MSIVFWLVIFTGCRVIISEPNHVIRVLLGIEILSIGVYRVMVRVLSFNGTLIFCLLFLTLSVCEAVLGLRVLVRLAKRYGKEKRPTFFLLKF